MLAKQRLTVDKMMLSAQPAPAMQTQEDLVALFSRNLVLNPELAAYQQGQQQLHQQNQYQPANLEPSPAPAPAPITYSISQHYHHSTHTIRQQDTEQQNPQRRASEPPQSDQESCEDMLRAHGVDISALGPSQTQLFRIAGPEQRARLVELWKIFPPASREGNPTMAWASTTMEQEEQLARMRYDQQQLEANSMGMDCGASQSSDGRWDTGAEPYMQSGYDYLMRREEQRNQPLADGPKDAYSHFGMSARGPRDQAGCANSRATEPVYGVENRYQSPAVNGHVSWEGVSRVHAPAGTVDAMEIL